MVLVDTSVWVAFFRGSRAPPLQALLEAGEAQVHPWVLGELALGQLGRKRAAILDDLRRLPPVAVVSDDEVLAMIEARSLGGRGVGWVDSQLLAAAMVAGSALWTLDRRLAGVASSLGLAAVPSS